jgi:hypothetical protein
MILMSKYVVRVLLLVLRLVGYSLMIQFYTHSSCCWCKFQTLGRLLIIIGIMLKMRGHLFTRVVVIEVLLLLLPYWWMMKDSAWCCSP